MKINIIGGGPAGMYFAILMKQADVTHDITLYERNGPDDTFGWGVVFSGKTLANLRAADESSHAEITRDF
ncbi:MAG TPA: NAD(P)-binding protein, partial [Pyrinomonadaceae bacterium]|nr:NAD(P)-binding protein [Pyrinomonadaceae bacterium]